MHTHEQEAFLAAIRANPNDDTPRLIYADWLDDSAHLLTSSDPERRAALLARAELIRTQCRLAHLPADHPERKPLRQREYDLLRQYEAVWLAELPTLCGVRWGRFERGFVNEVIIEDCRAVRLHGSLVMESAPISHVSFPNLVTWLYLRNASFLRCIQKLILADPHTGAVAVREILASPMLCNLVELDLRQLRLDDVTVQVLATQAHLGTLRTLWLGGNAIGDLGTRALAESGCLMQLQLLDLSANRLGRSGVWAVATSTTLGRLKSLDLANNLIGGEAMTLFVQQLRLAGLASLCLSGTGTDDDTAYALAQCEALRYLDTLTLRDNHITCLGASALARSIVLTQLRELDLSHNQIKYPGAEALAHSPTLVKLQRLSMAFNPIGQAGHVLLREREHARQARTAALRPIEPSVG